VHDGAAGDQTRRDDQVLLAEGVELLLGW
jgi:hypothetical protein